MRTAKKPVRKARPIRAQETRVQETREAEVIHPSYESWDTESLLDTRNIPPRPGMVQRWVRTNVKSEVDQSNIFRKMNKGWRPRLRSTVPKEQFVPKIDFEGTEVIGIRGLILMERPKELNDKQAQYVRQQTNLQMQSVKSDLFKVHDPSSGFTRPEFTEKSTYTVGRMPDIDD